MSGRRTFLCLLALLVPAVPAAAGESTGFQGGPAHSGSLTDASLTPPLRPRWTHELAGWADSDVVIADGLVAVVSQPAAHEHRLQVLDADDGHELWSAPLGEDHARVAYDDHTLFTSDDQGKTTAFDARTGAVRWADPAIGSFFWAPVSAVGGLVYITDTGGGIRALDAATGALRWQSRPTFGSEALGPAYADGTLYQGWVGASGEAYDALTGKILWTTASSNTGGGGSPTVVAGGRVFGSDGQVYDAASGARLYRLPSDSTPAVGADTLVMRAQSAMIGADPATGATRWAFTIEAGEGGGTYTGLPFVADGLVYFGDLAGTLTMLRASDGAVVDTVPVGTDPIDSVAAGERMLLVPSGAHLVAYEGTAPPAPAAPDSDAPGVSASNPSTPSVSDPSRAAGAPGEAGDTPKLRAAAKRSVTARHLCASGLRVRVVAPMAGRVSARVRSARRLVAVGASSVRAGRSRCRRARAGRAPIWGSTSACGCASGQAAPRWSNACASASGASTR